jgi:DNA-binding XRE family transcriptional regulator
MRKKPISSINKKRLEALAIYLRELRYSESMSQNEISHSLNLHRNTIIRAENAENLTLLTVFEIADAFDISISELFQDIS